MPYTGEQQAHVDHTKFLLDTETRILSTSREAGQTNLQHDQALLLIHMSLTKLAVQESGQDMHLMLGGSLQVPLVHDSPALGF